MRMGRHPRDRHSVTLCFLCVISGNANRLGRNRETKAANSNRSIVSVFFVFEYISVCHMKGAGRLGLRVKLALGFDGNAVRNL